MLADRAVRLGLVVAASLAIAACGSSAKTSPDAIAGDLRPTISDVGVKHDLLADGVPVYPDAAADAGVAVPDAGPEAPSASRDGVSPEPGTDAAFVSLDDVGRESAAVTVDGGPEGNPFRKDADLDGGAPDVGQDGGDAAILYKDGGGMDSGLAPLIITDPDETFFGGTLFTITNASTVSSGNLTATLTGQDASHFTIASNTCKGSLPPGGKCEVNVDLNHRECGGAYTVELSVVAEEFPGQVFTAQSMGLCV
jgi:hypothetical protein